MTPAVGALEIEYVTDGVPIIRQADDTIAVSLDLLITGGSDAVRLDGADVIVVAGSVRYRPVKWDLDMQTLICWRVA